MSVPVPSASSNVSRRSIRGGLSRTILIILLGVSILPLLILGGVTYFRTRSLLHDQMAGQMLTIVNSQGKQLEDSTQARQDALKLLLDQSMTSGAIQLLLTHTDNSDAYLRNKGLLQLTLNSLLTSQTTSFFDQVILLDANGKVILSTQSEWVGQDLGKEETLHKQLSSAHSAWVLSPISPYAHQLVQITVMPYINATSGTTGTLVGFTTDEILRSSLSTITSFHPYARAFLYSSDEKLYTLAPQPSEILEMTPNGSQHTLVSALNAGTTLHSAQEYTDSNNNLILAVATRLPNSNLILDLEIPGIFVYEQLSTYVTTYLILMFVLLALVALFAWFAARQLVEPLVQLTRTTIRFAEGDWTERSEIYRRDEIGTLAGSFNEMADELTRLYRSLESQVVERTQQMRMATEVAQAATSTSNLEETLNRTITLLMDRFGYMAASIYLIDSSGEYAVLREASGEIGKELIENKVRLVVGSQSIIGWVSAHNQSCVTSTASEDPLHLQNTLRPEARSEAAIPISSGNQVIGVLEVQSHDSQGFDNDTVVVLQNLANQIASAIQNVRLLELTEVNLQETVLLYQAGRQISQASNEEAALEIAVRSMQQTAHGSAILLLQQDHFKVLPTLNIQDKTLPTLPEKLSLPSRGIEAVLSTSNPTLIGDIDQESQSQMFSLLAFPRKLNHSSAAFIPVRSGGTLRAFMLYSSPDRGAFTDTLIQPYANLAEMLGSTLEKIQALQMTEIRLNQMQSLNQIVQAISLETDLAGLHRVIHQQIQLQFGDVAFSIAHYDPNTDQIEFPYVYEGDATISVEPQSLGDGLTSHLIRTAQPLLLGGDTQAEAQAMGARVVGKPAKSWLGVPLIVASQVIGAMIIQDVDQEGRFTVNDLALMNTLAPEIAIAIRNVQLLNDSQQALKAYGQERFLLNTLLQNIPDQIYFKNLDSRYLRVSRSKAVQFGMEDSAHVEGKSDYDFLPVDQAVQEYALEQKLIRDGESQIGLIEKGLSTSGSDRWMLTSRLPLHDTGNEIVGLFGISRDITDLKNAQDVAQKRAQQLRTAAEIARDTSGTLDLDELLQKVVNLVRERFNFYHASIFLLDPTAEFAVLRQSTGEAGRQMLEREHKLGVGSQSTVGQATLRGEPLVINDVTKDPTHLVNPLLPDTRAELAIPLKVADRILGALDVQSTQKQAFSGEEVSILQVLADQLAIAVVNANFFAESQETLTQHRLLHQITTAAASCGTVDEALRTAAEGLRLAMGGDRVTILLLDHEQKALQMKAHAGYEAELFENWSLPLGQGIAGWVALNRQPLRVDDTSLDSRYLAISPSVRSELAVPLIYRDELLGVLSLESEQPMAYDDNAQSLVGTLGASLAPIIANARLIEQIRHQVDRQRQLFEATSNIRRSVDIQKILETSAVEIGKAVGARKTRIEILPTADTAQPSSPNGKNNGQEKKS